MHPSGAAITGSNFAGTAANFYCDRNEDISELKLKSFLVRVKGIVQASRDAWNNLRNTIVIYEYCGGMLSPEQETKTYVTKRLFALKSRIFKT